MSAGQSHTAIALRSKKCGGTFFDRVGKEPAAACGGSRQVDESSKTRQATERCEGSLTKIELADTMGHPAVASLPGAGWH